jgi:hypothetical protein
MNTIRTANPTARKVHRCQDCYTAIQPGQSYYRFTTVYDGRVVDWIECRDCQEIAGDVHQWCEWHDEGVGPEDFYEWAREHEGDPQVPQARDYLARRQAAAEGGA